MESSPNLSTSKVENWLHLMEEARRCVHCAQNCASLAMAIKAIFTHDSGGVSWTRKKLLGTSNPCYRVIAVKGRQFHKWKTQSLVCELVCTTFGLSFTFSKSESVSLPCLLSLAKISAYNLKFF